MTNDGHLKFGVWVGFADTITSGNAYNDGQWHQVVATQGSSGLNLFVDGAKVGARRPDRQPVLQRLLAGRRRQPGRLAERQRAVLRRQHRRDRGL